MARGGKKSQRRKFAAAARACKGKGKKFRSCMRAKLKGR